MREASGLGRARLKKPTRADVRRLRGGGRDQRREETEEESTEKYNGAGGDRMLSSSWVHFRPQTIASGPRRGKFLRA